MSTILLTGMPRSGTTLLCSLLHQLPNAVALAEPMQAPASSEAVDQFVEQTRRVILEQGVAPSKTVDGQLSDNFVPPPSTVSGLRPSHAVRRYIRISKPLTDDFTLYIKHPASFTAMADQLRRRYQLYALIRNPLATLASWQTVDMAVQRGRLPAAERIDSGLRVILDGTADRLGRQIAIMSWFLRIYRSFPPSNVLRYEDLLNNPAATLAPLHNDVRSATWTLSPHSPEQRYPNVDISALAGALRPLSDLASAFYPDFEQTLARYA